MQVTAQFSQFHQIVQLVLHAWTGLGQPRMAKDGMPCRYPDAMVHLGGRPIGPAQLPSPTRRLCPCQYGSRSCAFSTLPAADSGIALRAYTVFGYV